MCLKLCFISVLSLTIVQGNKRAKNEEWNHKDGSDKVNMRGVANLTEVLDNWRFDIVTQIKNLLLTDHQAILPDYSRIQVLSETVNDLFKEFNALKDRLGDLSEKFMNMETFIDEVKSGQINQKRPGEPRQAGDPNLEMPTPIGTSSIRPKAIPKKKVVPPKKKKTDTV